MAGLVLAGLLWVKGENYLLFHTLAELFSIIIATSAFVVAWNSRRFRQDSYLTFLGLALVSVAGVDLIHTLAYKGMGILPDPGADPPTQLWIAARYLEAGSLMAAPLLAGRQVRVGLLASALAGIVLLLLLSIFAWDVFPSCFVEGRGLTPFKRISEYIIAVMILAAMAIHWRRRRHFHPNVLLLLLGAMGVTILQELAFTFYADPYAAWNFVGHLLKITAFFLLYKAIVVTGLTRPFDLLFRDLQQGQLALRLLNETLEERVALRTAEAEQRARQLRLLAAELTRTEERERRRLAQVLHDHLQQLLVAAKMRSGAIQRRVAAPQQRELTQVLEILDMSIDATRSLTAELSPPGLYQSGLIAALEWLQRQSAEVHGLEVELEADPGAEPLLGQDARVFLFRAARELLFNAVKHAGVRRARVRLGRDGDGGVVLGVEDEGSGYDPAAEAGNGRTAGGFGLASIRERAELLGGSFEVESAPGAGTRVRLRVPAEDG